MARHSLKEFQMRTLLLVALATFVPLTSVSAQWYAPHYVPPAYIPNVQNGGLFIPIDDDNGSDSRQNEDGSGVSGTLQDTAGSIYKINKSQTRANLQALARRIAAVDPANGAQAQDLLDSNDVIGMVQGVMNQYGLQKNNVAHAYALYWVVYWGLANNVQDPPSERALQAVAAQAERGFAANAEFAQLDNAAKQAAAEELMALTAIFDATSEQAKSDPALAAQIAKASLEGSHKSGLELDRMILTDNGFMPR
jgi:hypothetical protein